MANVKISALPAATSVASADVLPIVQSATTKKATIQNVSDALGVTTTVANVSPGLVYITDVALSTTAIDGIFTSAFDNYRIVVNNASTSGANGLIQFQFRDTSNATVTSANYYSATLRYDSSGSANNYGVQSQQQAETGINLVYTGTWSSFAMDVYGPRLTALTSTSLLGVGAINGPSTVTSSSGYNATTAMAGIIFKLTAGSFATGRVFVYGYRKA